MGSENLNLSVFYRINCALDIVSYEEGHPVDGAHGGADDLGVEEVDAALRHDYAGCAGALCSAEYRSQVAGVLDVLKNHYESVTRVAEDVVERV